MGPLLMLGARLLGGAVARGAATRLGASAVTEAAAGRTGQFIGGAMANSAEAHRQRAAAADEYAATPRQDIRR